MNAEKKPAVLKDACMALGVPAGAEPRVQMAELMNLPQIQSVDTATAKKPSEPGPTRDNVPCQKTFVENEMKCIISCKRAAGGSKRTRNWPPLK